MSEEIKRVNTLGILAIVFAALFLAVGIFIGVRYAIMRIRIAAMPSIAIFAPLSGQPVFKDAITPVRVQAVSNSQKITSLEWYLDGALAGSVQGEPDVLSTEWQWLPNREGTNHLAFLAYAENGTLGLASVDVVVLAGADIDADGVPDALDQCPSEPGPALSNGCLLSGDDDQDGLVGDADLCPDAFGPPEFSGCPAGRAPDSDGDGIYDAIDRCPDESGFPDWDGCPISAWSLNADGDELPDFLDDCPMEYGPRDSGGCPLPSATDTDGDTVPDAEDACVDLPGSPAGSGCPLEDDRDRDGIADSDDRCPDDAGLRTLDGCPPGEVITDLDMDAVLDAMDICPGLPGLLAFCGCPMPNDRDGDGVVDAEDRCADIPGSSSLFGCPMATFPFDTYNAQYDFLPSIPFFFEKGEDDFMMYEPELVASVPGTSIYIPQPDDMDGDGVLDDEDFCDAQIGRPFNNGCPFPGDWDSDGIPDSIDPCSEFNGSCENPAEISKIQISLVAFKSDPSWAGIYCYGATNGDTNYSRIPIWNYEEPVFIDPGSTYLTISSRLIPQDSYVSLVFNCWGQPHDLTRHSQHLGEIHLDYHYFFWDGQTRKIRAYGSGGMFEVWIRINQVSYAIT